jgi:pimeloyl-ACP methyl ester carboxylesterase
MAAFDNAPFGQTQADNPFQIRMPSLAETLRQPLSQQLGLTPLPQDPCYLPGAAPRQPELRAYNPPGQQRVTATTPVARREPLPTNQAPSGGEPDQRGYNLPTRAEILANPERYGRPLGSPMSNEEFASQYFREFVARDLAYMKPFMTNPDGSVQRDRGGRPISAYPPEVQQFMQDFGYQSQPDESNVVSDPRTGLYAMRLNPTAPEPGREGAPNPQPMVAFRGTDQGFDWSTNGESQVGRRQYEENSDAIRRLMQVQGGQRLDLVGHSLGGALAQIAAARQTQDVGSLTTFQAPGISSADASAFDRNNRDGHVSVNHHRSSWDLVPMGGQQMTSGSFWHYGSQQWDPIAGHTERLLMANHPDYVGGGRNTPVDVTRYNTDPLAAVRPGTEALRGLAGMGSRPFIDLANGRTANSGDRWDMLWTGLGVIQNSADYLNPFAAAMRAMQVSQSRADGHRPTVPAGDAPPPAIMTNAPNPRGNGGNGW